MPDESMDATSRKKKKGQDDNRNSGGNPWSILSVLQSSLRGGGSKGSNIKPVEYRRGGKVRKKSRKAIGRHKSR